MGVDFDGANPKEHIFYLSKIGLLPKAVKKLNSAGKLEAHYPPSTVDLLARIYSLKQSGLAYSQISKFSSLNSNHTLPEDQSIVKEPFKNFTEPTTFSSQTIAYLIIGLILGYLISSNNSLRTNSLTTVTANEVKANSIGVNSTTQTTFHLLTTPNGDTNNDLYLVTIPKSNFSRLEKVNFSDINVIDQKN